MINILNERTGYGIILQMLHNIDGNNKDDIKSFLNTYYQLQLSIPKKYVYRDKANNSVLYPHISLLYNIKNKSMDSNAEFDKIQIAINEFFHKKSKLKGIEVELGDVKKFPNYGFDYDVIMIEVKSPILVELFEELYFKFKNEISHSDFQPHITITYVYKGYGNEILGPKSFTGKKIIFKSLTLTHKESSSERIIKI